LSPCGARCSAAETSDRRLEVFLCRCRYEHHDVPFGTPATGPVDTMRGAKPSNDRGLEGRRGQPRDAKSDRSRAKVQTPA
jgi:hypothetical protein